MPRIAIGLGSNLGERSENIRTALRLVAEQATVLAVSSLYETEPMYFSDQPLFLNAVAMAEVESGPLAALAMLKAIEAKVGRRIRERFGPREIDLDLLAYGSLRYAFHDGRTTVLEVPHPSIPERRFVLAPLAEIAGRLELPGMGCVKDLLSATDAQAGCVRKIGDAVLSLPR